MKTLPVMLEEIVREVLRRFSGGMTKGFAPEEIQDRLDDAEQMADDVKAVARALESLRNSGDERPDGDEAFMAVLALRNHLRDASYYLDDMQRMLSQILEEHPWRLTEGRGDVAG